MGTLVVYRVNMSYMKVNCLSSEMCFTWITAKNHEKHVSSWLEDVPQTKELIGQSENSRPCWSIKSVQQLRLPTSRQGEKEELSR